MPTERQILGAKIRAENERYVLKNRKPYRGGYEVPGRQKISAHLAKTFRMPAEKVSYFLTWSRSCTHPWSAGACDACPE